ncbi:hypothetical protein [uncultured Oxalicibacterium sp.]|uniref:helix-turn-helix domain-containing protein n=1 Tax=uncultured Oxalicibacterium sp. TaxID=1168540 RepID=UPI0025ED9933|nr:hypothetical protein [uncultured Oxalicibacterium sp.]
MTYEKLIEAVLRGRSVNATAKALGIPQKTFESYVKKKHFPNCSRTILLAKEAGIDIETAVKAISKAEMEENKTGEHLKAAMSKMSLSFNSLLRGANVGWKRVSTTAQ